MAADLIHRRACETMDLAKCGAKGLGVQFHRQWRRVTCPECRTPYSATQRARLDKMNEALRQERARAYTPVIR